MKKYVSMKMSNTLLSDYRGIVANCIGFGDSSVETLKHLFQFYKSSMKPVIQYGSVSVSGCMHGSVTENTLKFQKRIFRIFFFHFTRFAF